MEWLGGSEVREEGVIDSRNGVAAGPEKRCCTLDRQSSQYSSVSKRGCKYMCPTSKRLAFSRVHLWLSPTLRSEY